MSAALPQERPTVYRQMEALEIDAAITDLAKVVGSTAVEAGASAQYAPVLGHLVKARRALRESFGL
jgi:hypothetical protein